jgi:sugar lactone lactonase YvrE
MLRRVRRPVVEELEPRILYSADIAPGLVPDPQSAAPEVRTLDPSGDFAIADVQTAPGSGNTDATALQPSDAGAAATTAGSATPVAASAAAAPAVAPDSSAPGGAGTSVQASLAKVPLAFERNVGQTDAQVDFLARGSGYTVWLADGDAVLGLRDGDTTHVVRLDVLGTNADPRAAGENALGSTSSYLTGDATQWRANVDSYGAVRYDDVYDGVDLRYYGTGRQLEYDFLVQAGADASPIRLKFEGAQSLAIADNGDLILTLDAAGNAVAFKAPVSYQDGPAGRERVDSHYTVFDDGSIGFTLGAYDTSRGLVIDPILSYATYLGGTGTDTVFGMAADPSGNIYATGFTTSTDLPTSVGAFQTDRGGDDVFVAKFSPDLGTLLYATYVGGGGEDRAYGIAVDATGNAYVTGYTKSTDFPMAGAYQSTLKGAQDAFVFKLNATGTALTYSTYLGGTGGGDIGYWVSVDAAGSAYVTGYASSADFPLTAGAVDAAYTNGETFVTKLSPTGSSLVYSTFIGGNDVDTPYSIALDGSGNAVVVGVTKSTDLAVTANAWQTSRQGASDAFVTMLNASGSAYLYNSYLGGGNDDTAYSVALDSTGKIYVVGTTQSNDFDVTASGLRTVRDGTDGFLSIIDPAQSGAASLTYSTYIGGNKNHDEVWGVAVDSAGLVYLAGLTDADSNFPVTADAYQTTRSSGDDAYVVVLNPAIAGTGGLVYGSYFGGSGNEAVSTAVLSQGRFYIGGQSFSASGIATPGAYSTVRSGTSDGFIAAFTINQPPTVATSGILSYSEGSGAVVIDPAITVSDPDTPNLVGATITISGNYASPEDQLVFDNLNSWGITGTWNPATATMTLAGTSSVANYQAALGAVRYSNASDNPSTATRTLSFTVNDGTNPSLVQTRQITVTRTNDAPTAIAISNGQVVENTDTTAGFTVGTLSTSDPDIPDTATYSIVPGADAAVFKISGSDLVLTDGVLDYETKNSYTVTVRSTDSGGLSVDRTFSIAVTNVNEPPTVTPIGDQVMDHDTVLAVPFIIGDPETAAGALALGVVSSNQALLPNANLVVSGTGANLTLTLTPAAGQVGSTTVILQVSDGTNVTSQSFVLTVNPDNAAPVISASGFTVAENSANGTILGSVAAVDPDVTESFSKIYYADYTTGSIVRSNLDGSSVQTIVGGLTTPMGVAVDYLGGKVYWTDTGTDRIQRANLDGTSVQTILTGLSNPIGLKVDGQAGKLYFIDSGTASIRAAALDGSNVQVLLSTVNGLSAPTALDLDASSGKLYWIDDGNNTIRRANLDGTGIETLVTSGISAPTGLALDVANNKMYWSDSGTSRIGRANLDGSALQAAFLSTSSGVNGVSVDSVRQQIYWTEDDLLNARVRRANLDGTGVTTVVNTGLPLLSSPSGIALGPPVPALTYAITSGNTSGAFAIDQSGTITVANQSALDFETTPTFNLGITVTDAGGAATTKAILVNLTNVNEPPAITGSFSVAPIPEDGTTGPIAFTVSDPDTPLDQLQVTFLDSTDPSKIGAGNVQFGGSGANRTVTITPAADAFGGTTTVRIKVSDGQFSVLGSIPVTILAVADTPAVTNAATNRGTQTTSGLVISPNPVDGASVTHYQISNIVGGTLFKSDGTTQILSGQFITVAEGGAGLKFTPLPGGTAPGSFDVRAATAPNVAGLGGGTVTASIAINNAPTGIAVSNAQVAENSDTSAGYVVGTLSATDPDPGNTFTYSIAGGTDATRFTIVGNQLVLTAGVLDYETKPSYQVTVRTTDQGNLSFDQALTISVLNVNEPPTISTVADQTVQESSGATTVTFTVGDPESAPSGLTVSATSSNGAVIPAGSLVLGGSGANRTLTFTPAPFAYGTSTVTLSVSDGTNTTSSTFAVAVTPVANHDVTVDTISDTSDGDTSSIDTLLMNRGADGKISLREAIAAANASPNAGSPDRILFNIGGVSRYFIDLTAALPTIDDAVVIDGTSQPGYTGTPLIEVHGDVPGIDGFVLNAGGSKVRGLSVIGFDGGGIVLNGGSNTIAGNYVGLEADGSTIHSNGIGIIVRSTGNLIGGVSPGERNVISGNSTDGIWFDGANGNQVIGNYIGTDATGALPRGNGVNGVCLDGGGGSNNTIGGAGGAQNLIAYNGGSGVGISVGTGNAVLENSIFGNGGLGIDLNDDGVTLNDPGDADTGPNLQMNFPVIYSVVVSGGNVTITGEAAPGATVRFFQSPDASGYYGQGQTFLGSTAVAGSIAGRIDSTARQFTATLAAGSVAAGDRITATATDGSGNTSEFSLNVVATALPPGITVTPTSGLTTTEDGGTATFTLVLDTKPTANVTIGLSTNDATEGFPLTSSVTFTPSNWNVAQTVTVGGRPDGIPDGNVPYSILTAAATSTDPAYQTLKAADVTLTNLNGVNDPPSSLTLTNQSVAEQTNTSTGYVLGTLTSTDPDVFDQHVYSIAGGKDAAKFSVSGSALVLTDGVLSYAAKPSYQVIVRATDLGGATLDKTFTISVTPVAPVAPPPVVVPPVTTTPTTTTSTTNTTSSTTGTSTTTAADPGTSSSGSGASAPSGGGAGAGGAAGGGGSGGTGVPASTGALMDATFTAGGSGTSSQQRALQRVVLADSMLRGPVLTATLNSLGAVASFTTRTAAREAPDLSAQPQDLVIRGLESRPESIAHAMALTTYKASLGDTQWTAELNRMREDIKGQVPQQSALVVSSVAVTGSLSVGYVLWLLRGGLLLSSLLSSLPAWAVIDPMPVLSRSGHDDQDEGDDPLEKLFGRARAALGLKNRLFGRKPATEEATST